MTIAIASSFLIFQFKHWIRSSYKISRFSIGQSNKILLQNFASVHVKSNVPVTTMHKMNVSLLLSIP